MFKRENVNYPELIWEDLAYQIDHKKEKKSRRENMPYPRFTKVIIDYFLKQHESLPNLNHLHYHTIKDDGIVCRLKFVRIGKGTQGKKTADAQVEKVEVPEGSEPEPVKKRTSSKKRVKKTVTISAEDNIIPYPDVALEIVTESVPIHARRRSSETSHKLKGVQSLTPEEQEAADTIKALKESRKSSKRQPGTGGSHKGIGSKPGVLDESTVVSATSSEGTGVKPRVLDDEKDITEQKVILEWGDDQDSEHDDDDDDIDVVKDDQDKDWSWFWSCLLVQFPKKIKQEEVGEVRGRAYAIKDAEPKGPNVVTGASYELKLVDGRVVSTNTVLKGCTLNLVNHIFEIDLMPIELGTFDVIIGMDWLVKHDAVIVCGEKVVRIPYGNKMLIVKSDKGMSRLKVFPEEFPRLPPPRQVEFRIDLVPAAAPVARALYRLAPSEMRELSIQLQELPEKGFI
ncbi:putative reverse transcriptase domain-containing protein, partial [Tanacetum coccineum]